MESSEVGVEVPHREAEGASTLTRWLFRHVVACDFGSIVIETPSCKVWTWRGANAGPDCRVTLKSWKALSRLVTSGDLGFADAYRLGEWTSPDLVAFFNWVTANEAPLAAVWRGSKLLRVVDRLRHARRANTRRGSRRNISDHYDLGNAFYAAWLDAGMNYSSALYHHPGDSLETAQRNKLDRVLDHLDVPKAGKVLEIGCGWGGFAEAVLKRDDCHLTGVTVSAEQLRFAQSRLAKADLADRASLRFQDYRDLTGSYDAIVSIEMLEAVGEQYWPVYFRKVRSLLKPGGRAVLQVITIAEERFAAYRARPDFIQRFIFPGGMLPTDAHMHEQSQRAGLQIVDVESFPLSYAQTLAEWRTRFHAALPTLRQMGYDDGFFRLWDYYLSYCEAGFRNRALNVALYVLR